MGQPEAPLGQLGDVNLCTWPSCTNNYKPGDFSQGSLGLGRGITNQVTRVAGEVSAGEEEVSHCWGPDGSFHVVCMFVMGVGVVCALVTLVCFYKIYSIVHRSRR